MEGSIRKPFILAILCFNLISCIVSALTDNRNRNVSGDSGCCFNGTTHEVGSVVQEISEACLQFLCAVNQNKSTSSTVIVPSQIPLKDCKGTPCEDCFSTHCVDEKGLLHTLGSLWMPTKCSRCKCGADQTIICETVPVSCPARPDPSCIAVPDPCCTVWNCSNKCVDDDGKIRELGEEWGSPCIQNICTSSGIVTRIEDCLPLPLVNASCQVNTPEGQCCPQIDCGGCIDEEGKFRKLNEEWGSPCIKNICTSQGIATRIEDCPPLPIANASCQSFTPDNECCPQLKCGCIDDEGNFRQLSEEWGSPCILNVCTSRGIAIRIEDCIPTPFLNDSCYLYTPENQCCPEIICGANCSAVRCGLPPRPGNHCELYTPPRSCCPVWNCRPDCRVVRCGLPPKPANQCELYTPHLSCCPLWNCSGGCDDENGLFRELGAKWNSSHCNESECTKVGIISKPVTCKLSDPPHPNCELVTPLGKCCSDWNCGPDCRVVRCGLPPKPSNHCELYTPHLSCCSLWNCSGGCIDENGKYRELGAIWNPTSCNESVCTKDGGVSQGVSCRILDPPHFNCELVTPLGKCCPEWNCGPDCRVVRCGLPPKPANQCVLYTPSLSCCPLWNCSGGCVGDTGKYYELGAIWNPSPCDESVCTKDGVLSRAVNCTHSDPPHFNCELVTPLGKCCPEWKCGLDCRLVKCGLPPKPVTQCELYTPHLSCCPVWNCSCIDADGISHPVGSQWEKNCITFKCKESGIEENYVQCNFSEPEHYNCIPIIPAGECCPKWECGPNCALVLCQGPPQKNCTADPLPPLSCCATYTCPQGSRDSCLDSNGIQHPIGSYWENDCVLYECTKSGVVRNPVPCNLNLPEHYNCIPVVRPGECCPKWECGLNCAAVLCAAPPQINCKANPLAPLACCPTYTCPRSSRSTSDEFYPEEADVVLSIPL